ncbi:MAG: hypothetical protein QM820_23060 [Minicystis sp.]
MLGTATGWLKETRGLLDPQHVNRAAGVVIGALKVGPAVPSSTLYRALQRIGVLQTDPARWEESPAITRLPWGAERVAAPAPELPPGVRGPWPQAPHVGSGFYPAVLNIPDADRLEHFKYNVARYLGQLVQLTPAAAARALRGPRLSPLTDDAFVRMFTETSFGQFLRHDVEDHDRAVFAAVMGSDAATDCWATLDFSFCPTEHLLPGLHAAPTVTLLERLAPDRYRAAAIRVGDAVFTPGAGSAWALARYFVLQGAQCRLVSSTHPRLHFGVDPINAVTRTVLPEGHVVRRLLAPHMRFTLGLHEAVIHHRRSPIHNSQREVYTPFPFRTEGMHAQVAVGRHGWPGRRAYPAYRFDDGLFGLHVPYGRFRRDWLDLVQRYVEEVIAGASADDDALRAWADHIAAWVPGFPGGAEIHDDGVLARALARYICTVTVFHTADHHSYANLPLETIPFRLRVAPPDRAPPPATLDLDALVLPEDFYRHALSHGMFYAPVILEALRHVRPSFVETSRQAALARAKRAMDVLDARWQGSSFPSSREIGASLHY